MAKDNKKMVEAITSMDEDFVNIILHPFGSRFSHKPVDQLRGLWSKDCNQPHEEAITSMDEDFAKWYTDIVKKAELIEYTSVKGCMVIHCRAPFGKDT